MVTMDEWYQLIIFKINVIICISVDKEQYQMIKQCILKIIVLLIVHFVKLKIPENIRNASLYFVRNKIYIELIFVICNTVSYHCNNHQVLITLLLALLSSLEN